MLTRISSESSARLLQLSGSGTVPFTQTLPCSSDRTCRAPCHGNTREPPRAREGLKAPAVGDASLCTWRCFQQQQGSDASLWAPLLPAVVQQHAGATPQKRISLPLVCPHCSESLLWANTALLDQCLPLLGCASCITRTCSLQKT